MLLILSFAKIICLFFEINIKGEKGNFIGVFLTGVFHELIGHGVVHSKLIVRNGGMEQKRAPPGGLEPPTFRLTAERSTY